jgi:hypothetical protein
MAPVGGKQRGSRRILVPLSRAGIGLVMVEPIVELGAAIGEYKQGGDGSVRCQSLSSWAKSPSSIVPTAETEWDVRFIRNDCG